MKKILIIISIFSSFFSFSQTKVGDATLPNTLTIESQNLTLNGAGIREKLWFDIYAAGLYLENKSNNAKTIVDADQSMAIRLDILSGMLSKKKMIGAFEDGFKKTNSNTTINKLQKEFNTFLGFLNDEINVGDKYDLVYVPSSGTSLYKNSKKIGTVSGLLFKTAIFNIWLSNKPVDSNLKQELLN